MNAEQIRREFAARGAVVVADAVPPAALRWARAAVDRLVADQLASPTPSPGVAVTERDGERYVVGIHKVNACLGALPLYLMGLPAVVEAARAVCGRDTFCTHDWIVMKRAGDGHVIDWHQDFVHDGRYTAVNIGIHLDGADQDAVRFIPGPRRGAEEVGALRARYRYDSPDVFAAPVPAGGLTLHDVLLVHGSPPLAAGQRRTLYLEFRDPAMLAGHPTLPPEYLAARRELFALAQRVTQRLGDSPSGDPMALLEEDERQLMRRLEGMHARIEPANYGMTGAGHE